MKKRPSDLINQMLMLNGLRWYIILFNKQNWLE